MCVMILLGAGKIIQETITTKVKPSIHWENKDMFPWDQYSKTATAVVQWA